MKCIETIQLRATGCNKNLLKTELLKLIEENGKSTRQHVVTAYVRVLVDTDYYIQIFHETSNVDKNGSPLGLRLVSALKAFGLVNHNLWVALNNKR